MFIDTWVVGHVPIGLSIFTLEYTEALTIVADWTTQPPDKVGLLWTALYFFGPFWAAL